MGNLWIEKVFGGRFVIFGSLYGLESSLGRGKGYFLGVCRGLKLGIIVEDVRKLENWNWSLVIMRL